MSRIEPSHSRAMISFAQNYEDVILERIFKATDSGFYVDIGACHPVYDSVTHHFHLRGWTGVNVEPQSELFAEFQRTRSQDINLNVCVGTQSTHRTLYVTADRGTSTLVGSLGRRYRLEGRISAEIEVPVISLNEMWRQHVGGRRVDFLKIDVEGSESEILEGADFDLVNPLVMVVEAIHPTSRVPMHQHWEPLLLAHYRFFYFDGLNRFYHRLDWPFDAERFSLPPNVLDAFKTHREHLAEEACRHLSVENESFREQLQNFERWLGQKDAALEHAAKAYAELESRFQKQLQDLERGAGKG